jgi:hypothetical protein
MVGRVLEFRAAAKTVKEKVKEMRSTIQEQK